MSLTGIIAGGVIDIAKSYLFEKGKQVAHDFKDSATGKTLGEIIAYRKEENPNVLLFVHGFSGSSAETFGETPNMLINNSKFNGWDIFSVGYSSSIFPSIGKGLWSVDPDITKIAAYLNTLLTHQFQDYERVAIVGHSMGGLAVQRAILDSKEETFKKISHLILFGTPSLGLKKASAFRFWNTQVHDLAHESDFIKNLRKDWSARFPKDYNFTFRTIAGSKDEFVPEESSLSPFDEKYRGIIEGNHITMIKPIGIDDNEHQSYNIILNVLVHNSNLQGEPDIVNILMAKYHTIINQDLPKASSLMRKPLINLVFALENSGRKKEALQVLLNHPGATTDSDIIGVIGGRYKRELLLNREAPDFYEAVKYYSKGLEMAKAANNTGQIFYHAINLAFLYIYGDDDKDQMKSFAQLALDNCDTNSINLWEIATIAEANLYLGKHDVAEIYYRKAAKIADLREKLSIYSNAYLGYQALVSSEKKDADFLIMLGSIFFSVEKPKLKVYISSTYKDLKDFRAFLIDFFDKEGSKYFEKVRIMEHMYDAGNSTPFLKTCLEEVKKCDVYMIILGQNAGSFPPNDTITYTHHEYLTALESKKKIFRYAFSGFDETLCDDITSYNKLKEQFKGMDVHTFKDVDDFQVKCLKSLFVAILPN